VVPLSYAYRKPGNPIPGDESYAFREKPDEPDRRIGAHAEKIGGYPGNFPTPLEESSEIKQQNAERAEFDKKVKAYEAQILAIQQKFIDIEDLTTTQKKGFYIRFDAKLYPHVSNAVKFYTDHREDDYIDEDTYARAKTDIETAVSLELERTRDTIRTGAEPGAVDGIETPRGGVNSIKEQIEKKRAFNVFLMAFKQILGYLVDWVFSLGVIKAARSFFRSGKYRNASGARKETLNEILEQMGISGHMVKGSDGRWDDISSRDELNIKEPGDLDRITPHAEKLLRYVVGVIQEDEVAIVSHIPNPTPFLIDQTLLPMKKEFFNVVEITETFIDTDAIRNIGQGSSAYIPESVPYDRQANIITTTVQPLFQEEFLQRLDDNLARILRILQGWYLDPRTYCCLLNALGGIGSLVPKWLHALRFGLHFAIAQIDFEMAGISKKITNILNLIVQGILGSIVMHLHSFAAGYLSKNEHELMGSILNSSSKFLQCAPFDVLVSEYTQYFRGILSQLRVFISALTGKLLISMDHYDQTVTLLEKRHRMVKLLDILDLFIDAWQMGYICGDRGIVIAGQQDAIQNIDVTEDTVTGITGSTTISDAAKDDDRQDEIQTGEFQPLISKEEMITFMKTKLDLPDTFIDDASKLYDDPSTLKGCAGGFSPTVLTTYKLQIEQAIKTGNII